MTFSTLHVSANDKVKKLLEKARKLREEAAAMSGKTLEEVEEEAKQEKKLEETRQEEILDKA